MSQTAQHTNETKDKHRSHAYAKVWLFFMYYWIILGLVVTLVNFTYGMEKTLISCINGLSINYLSVSACT